MQVIDQGSWTFSQWYLDLEKFEGKLSPQPLGRTCIRISFKLQDNNAENVSNCSIGIRISRLDDQGPWDKDLVTLENQV